MFVCVCLYFEDLYLFVKTTAWESFSQTEFKNILYIKFKNTEANFNNIR